MKSFTLVLQVVGIALIAPSLGLPQHPALKYKSLVKPAAESFGAYDTDFVLAQPAAAPVEKTLRIIAAEKRPSESREEFLVRKRLQEEELQRQAESAKYSFASSLNDRIMDGEHIRSETREGLKTTGSYTYSDGFVRRTVEYVADENGYRVINMKEEMIGDGPQPDPSGSADVSAYYDRSKLKYSITADDIRGYYTTDDDLEEEEVTKTPFAAAFARSSVPKVQPTARVAPVPVATLPPIPAPVPTPKVEVSNDFDTHQILRPAERHEIQTPVRPLPHLRGQYFTQVHSL